MSEKSNINWLIWVEYTDLEVIENRLIIDPQQLAISTSKTLHFVTVYY